MKTVKFYAYGANGSTDPRQREGSGEKCAHCGHEFSFWDDLQRSPTDIALKCATCKKIRIALIEESPEDFLSTNKCCCQ